jgi:hypothetical protein
MIRRYDSAGSRFNVWSHSTPFWVNNPWSAGGLTPSYVRRFFILTRSLTRSLTRNALLLTCSRSAAAS